MRGGCNYHQSITFTFRVRRTSALVHSFHSFTGHPAYSLLYTRPLPVRSSHRLVLPWLSFNLVKVIREAAIHSILQSHSFCEEQPTAPKYSFPIQKSAEFSNRRDRFQNRVRHEDAGKMCSISISLPKEDHSEEHHTVMPALLVRQSL